jgi:hypothetical protein
VSGLIGDIADAVDIRASDYEVQNVTADGDLSIDRSVSKHCVITLNGDVTSFEITGWPPAGLLGNLTLEVHNTGSFLINVWPDGTIFAPTPSPLGVDIYLAPCKLGLEGIVSNRKDSGRAVMTRPSRVCASWQVPARRERKSGGADDRRVHRLSERSSRPFTRRFLTLAASSK